MRTWRISDYWCVVQLEDLVLGMISKEGSEGCPVHLFSTLLKPLQPPIIDWWRSASQEASASDHARLTPGASRSETTGVSLFNSN